MLRSASAILVASLLAGTAHANIINGSFESATVDPGSGFVTLYSGDTSIMGWTVIGTGVQYSIDYIGGYWQAADGDRSIDLSGNGQGGIYQDIVLDAGWYIANFMGAANPDSPTDKPNPRVGVFSADSYNELISYTLDGSETRGDMNWIPYTTDRFYSDGTTRISFLSGTVSPYGFALDNVVIDAVPEPAVWALLLIGFGAVGSQIRRRRNQWAVAHA